MTDVVTWLFRGRQISCPPTERRIRPPGLFRRVFDRRQERGDKMSDLQTLTYGGGAGLLTSVFTMLLTMFGFHKRLERLEQEKVSREIHEMCSTGIIAQMADLRKRTEDADRDLLTQLRSEIKALHERYQQTDRAINELTRRIDRVVNGYEYATRQMATRGHGEER